MMTNDEIKMKVRMMTNDEIKMKVRAITPCSDSRSLAERCSGCGMLFKTIVKAAAGLPELLAMHLESAPDCVEVYCEEPDNLVDLEAGKLAIRQTLFVCGYAGGSGVAGIAPCGERRVFFYDPCRWRAEAWLAERMERDMSFEP